MLSEKAKGKQRAAEPPDDDHVAGQGSATERERDAPRDLLIRFTEGVPDLSIAVNSLDSARDVKRRIRDARPELLNRRLRLIHSGRLLTNETLLHPWLTSLEGRQKPAETEDSDAGPVNSLAAAKPAAMWFHCSIGQPMTSDDPEEEDRSQTTQIQPIRGFDRLAAVGFSQPDIENLRRHFHSLSSSNYLDHTPTGEEDYDEHIRALEDQWIDSMADAESGSAFLSSSFPNPSSLHGLLMGFFFPLLPFFLVHEEKPAVFWEDDSEQETSSVLLSPTMKTGLLVGFLANVLFGMWRYLLES